MKLQNDSEAEGIALMQVSLDWAKACATQDLELIAAFWAEDAIVLPPDQPAIIGKQAIREYVRHSLSMPGFSLTWEPERAVVAGNLGYLLERNRSTFTDSNGTLQTVHGKVVTIWRKDSSGRWKCAVDIWNGNPSDHVLPA